jgi:DNA-binding NtrC family response regulator
MRDGAGGGESNYWTATSAAMRSALDVAMAVAHSSTPVLIVGETGSGRESLARHIHHMGPRAERSFVARNLDAVPDPLKATSLFGHVTGAFEGLIRHTAGALELASASTLYVSGILALSAKDQEEVMRTIDRGFVEPIGGHGERFSADVRLIASETPDTLAAVERASDLILGRVATTTIRVPALRERLEDLPGLVGVFILQSNERYSKHVKGIDDEALRLLAGQTWLGNVRELQNVIARLVTRANGESITAADLRKHL